MKNKKTILFAVLCLSVLVAVSMTILKSVTMVNYFNSETMQFPLEKTHLNNIVIVVSLIFSAIAFASFFFVKDYEINDTGYRAPVRIVSGIIMLAVGVYGAVGVLFIDPNVAAKASNFQAHQMIMVIASIFALISSAYLLLSVKGDNKSISIISVALPLWCGFGILASYFNPFYSLLDPNRLIYAFFLMSSGIMFIKACKNLFYENKTYVSAVLSAMVSMTFSSVFLIPNVVYIISKGKPVTLFALENLSALVVLIMSVSIIISGLRKAKLAEENNTENDETALD